MRQRQASTGERGTVIVEYSLGLILLWMVAATAMLGLINVTRSLYAADSAGIRNVTVAYPQVEIP